MAPVLIGAAKASNLTRNAALFGDERSLNWAGFDAQALC